MQSVKIHVTYRREKIHVTYRREGYVEQLWEGELLEIRFKDGESVDDFSMPDQGDAAGRHLEQVAISIETLLDINDQTVEEVIRRMPL